MECSTEIDFETAHGYRWSICQVGLVRVNNSNVTDEINLLIQPPNNYYWDRFIDIHGITPDMTKEALTFDKVWHKLEAYIKGQAIVAHNGLSFDFPVLEITLEYYSMENPKYEKHCTYRLFRQNLASLCNHYKISLNHHDALSDAKACAELFLIHLQSINNIEK